MTDDAITCEIGSGNVFADIGLPDADDMLIKAQIPVVLQRLIKAESWTPALTGSPTSPCEA
jgi:hypothetical protein